MKRSTIESIIQISNATGDNVWQSDLMQVYVERVKGTDNVILQACSGTIYAELTVYDDDSFFDRPHVVSVDDIKPMRDRLKAESKHQEHFSSDSFSAFFDRYKDNLTKPPFNNIKPKEYTQSVEVYFNAELLVDLTKALQGKKSGIRLSIPVQVSGDKENGFEFKQKSAPFTTKTENGYGLIMPMRL